jgi:hypothetical protein
MPAEERPCARQIITRLGGEAYRRALTPAEIDRLMPFYEKGAAKGGFEIGVRNALEAILASPHFIFRLEKEPDYARPGTTYRVADVDLASRLSFFLWGTPPDQELLTLASQGKLTAPGALEKQAKRMLADPRSDALGTRFAAQWLRLQDIDKVHPDPNNYPNFDDNLASDMHRETELFFNSLVRDDRSVTDLFRANYTFVNDASPGYGWGVSGDQFPRRISGRHAPRVAGAGRHARANLPRQPYVAGAARQVGDGSPDGLTAAAPSTGHSYPGGNGGREERQDAHDARTDGDAPREPDLQLLPPLHGSDWPGARQFRRHGEMAHP